MGRGEGLGEMGEGLALPLPRAQAPTSSTFWGERAQGQRWTQIEPNSPPPPTKGPPKQQHEDWQGAEPAPQL